MEVALIQILSFMAVVLFVVGLNTLREGQTRQFVREKPLAFRLFSTEIETLGKFLGPPVNRAFPLQADRIRKDLLAAALAPVDDLDVRGLQGFMCIAIGVVGATLVAVASLNWSYALLTFIICALIGWVYPVTWVSGCARKRKAAMSKALPYAIDLITVAMEAGQDFGAALRHFVEEGPHGPLRTEFAVTLRETELGKSRIEALQSMADRIQLDEFRSLATTVTQSSEMGASISQTLKIQAEEIRRARYQSAERQAARAPSLLLFPTAIFIVPAVFVIIFTPVIMRIKGAGLGAAMGQ